MASNSFEIVVVPVVGYGHVHLERLREFVEVSSYAFAGVGDVAQPLRDVGVGSQHQGESVTVLCYHLRHQPAALAEPDPDRRPRIL